MREIADSFEMDAEIVAHYNKAGERQLRLPMLWRMCPHGLLYPLKKGESLCAAAKRFGLTVYELLEYNPMLNPAAVVPGQILIVRRRLRTA